MKKWFYALVMVALTTSAARADAFQLIRSKNGSPIADARVLLDDRLVGYTNRSGIVVIRGPSGTNTYTVSAGKKTVRVPLKVSGNPEVQTVQVEFP